MSKFNPSANLTNYASIIAAVCLFAALLIVVFLAWPKFQEFKVAQENVEDKKAEIVARKEYVLKLDEIKAKLESYEQEFPKVSSALPPDPSLPSLFNYLQNISSQSGLQLIETSSFSVSSSKNLAGLKEAVFGAKFFGDYSSLKNFISTIEKSTRLIEVTNVSFSSKKQSEKSFEFDIKFKSYSY